jgi:hypothetical protein
VEKDFKETTEALVVQTLALVVVELVAQEQVHLVKQEVMAEQALQVQ